MVGFLGDLSLGIFFSHHFHIFSSHIGTLGHWYDCTFSNEQKQTHACSQSIHLLNITEVLGRTKICNTLLLVSYVRACSYHAFRYQTWLLRVGGRHSRYPAFAEQQAECCAIHHVSSIQLLAPSFLRVTISIIMTGWAMSSHAQAFAFSEKVSFFLRMSCVVMHFLFYPGP